MDKKMIRMVAADLDHTLLREEGTISGYTADVLARCRREGVRFAVATARPMRTLTVAMGEVPYDAAVYLNGAAVWVDGRIAVRHTIAAGDAARILRVILGDSPEAWVSVETEDRLYVNFDLDLFKDRSNVSPSDLLDLPDRPVDKIIVSRVSDDRLAELRASLPKELYLHDDRHGLTFIMNARATKEDGLTDLAAMWGLPLEQCAAFGDDSPDAAMMGRCGIGVAVGNATEGALCAADEVCPSNEEDGVARWIEANILSKT